MLKLNKVVVLRVTGFIIISLVIIIIKFLISYNDTILCDRAKETNGLEADLVSLGGVGSIKILDEGINNASYDRSENVLYISQFGSTNWKIDLNKGEKPEKISFNNDKNSDYYSVSGDGRYVFYNMPDTGTQETKYFIYDRKTGKSKEIKSEALMDKFNIGWTENPGKIYFHSFDIGPTLFIYDLENNFREEILDLDKYHCVGTSIVKMSPDGKKVFFNSYYSGLCMLDKDSGQVRTIYEYGDQFFCCSPDGKYIAINPEHWKKRIVIVDISGNKRRYLPYSGTPHLWIPAKRSNFFYLTKMIKDLFKK